jgi:hypothetical protein
MKQTSMGCLLGITLFWWGITGTFSGIVVLGIARHLDAEHRFRSTDGTVLRSWVETSRGRKSTQYSPHVQYRYTAEGKELVGDRYTFDTSSSSDTVLSNDVVRAHPAGKTVTVYYDPDHPETAILSLPVPNSLLVLLLFIQPFLTIGMVLLYALVTTPFAIRRVDRFLGSPPTLPWEIPGWGRMDPGSSGWSLVPKPPRVAFSVGAYIFTSLVGAVVAILGGGGFSNPPRWLIFSGFGMAIGSALVVGPILAGRMTRAVLLDSSSGTLTVTSRNQTRTLGLAEISGIIVDRPLRVVRTRSTSRTEPGEPRLGAVLKSGEVVELNRFVVSGDAEAVARKAAEEVARTAGCPLRARGDLPFQ